MRACAPPCFAGAHRARLRPSRLPAAAVSAHAHPVTDKYKCVDPSFVARWVFWRPTRRTRVRRAITVRVEDAELVHKRDIIVALVNVLGRGYLLATWNIETGVSFTQFCAGGLILSEKTITSYEA